MTLSPRSAHWPAATGALSWHARAACRDYDPELWWPTVETGGRPTLLVHMKHARAVDICRTCPVLAECRQAGATEPQGIWGGTWPHERKARDRRRCQPRPVEVRRCKWCRTPFRPDHNGRLYCRPECLHERTLKRKRAYRVQKAYERGQAQAVSP